MAQRVEPGSEWVLRRGVHAGTVISVEGQSDAGSVKYRVIKGGDNTGSASEDDDGRVHTTSRDRFFTLYEPNRATHGNGTQAPFRQNNRRQKGQAMLLEPEAEVQQLLGNKQPVGDGHYVHPGTSGLGIAVEMITPQMAQAWLDRGGSNRKPSERAILRLMHAIQLGEWDLTGETIKLDGDGKVRDGQHRLWAVVRTGITVPSIVVRGVPESAFDKIDTGKSRSMADVLSIHGQPSATALATAARGLMLIETYGRYDVGSAKTGRTASPSNAQGVAYVEAHPEMIHAVHEADRLRKEGRFVGGSGLWAIALTLFWRIDPEQTRVFVGSLIEGANLETGSPILRLRNMYKGGTARDWQSNNTARQRLLATVIKGWNAWRRDELVQGLSWHDSGRGAEKFPVAE